MSDDPWAQFTPAPGAPPAGGDPWAQFTPAPQAAAPQEPPGVISDMAKAVPSGLAKGTIGLAASPFDIPRAIAKGLEYLVGKSAPDTSSSFPGENDVLDVLRGNGAKSGFLAPKIQSAVESATGPLYQPQTTPRK